MIGDILQPTHLLFILVIALLVLGPKRLPEVGRSLGRGLRDFRSAISGEDQHDQVPPTTGEQAPAQPAHQAVDAPPAAPTTPPPSADVSAPAAAPAPTRTGDEHQPAAPGAAEQPAEHAGQNLS